MTIAPFAPTPLATASASATPTDTEGAGTAPADFLAALAEALDSAAPGGAVPGGTTPTKVSVTTSTPTPTLTLPVPALGEPVATPVAVDEDPVASLPTDDCPPATRADETTAGTAATAVPTGAEIAVLVGATPATPAVPAHRADPTSPRPTDRRGNAATPATPAVGATPAHGQATPATATADTPATATAGTTATAVPGAVHRSATGAEHQRADQAPGRLHTADRPSLDAGPLSIDPSGPTADPGTTTATTTGAATTPTPATTPTTTPTAPLQLPTQVSGPSAAAAPLTATAPATNPSPQLDQVSAQVFGEVTGLVSRGPGTHRITLTLQPEQLGEVRVVMTMRQGAVHVRLAAGHDARISLANGSAELTRLLEQAGVTETRIVVRELPAAATQSSTFPTPGSNPDAQLGAGHDRTPDQHAGTRADHPATDGAAHPRLHRSPVSAEVRPIQSVNATRLAGVDLTM